MVACSNLAKMLSTVSGIHWPYKFKGQRSGLRGHHVAVRLSIGSGFQKRKIALPLMLVRGKNHDHEAASQSQSFSTKCAVTVADCQAFLIRLPWQRLSSFFALYRSQHWTCHDRTATRQTAHDVGYASSAIATRLS